MWELGCFVVRMLFFEFRFFIYEGGEEFLFYKFIGFWRVGRYVSFGSGSGSRDFRECGIRVKSSGSVRFCRDDFSVTG